MRLAVMFLVILAAACGARETTSFSLVGTEWHDLRGTPLQLRLGKTDLAVTLGDRVLAQLPLVTGSTIDAPIEGRHCTIGVLSTGTASTTDYRADTKQPTTRDLKTRTFGTVDVELRCSDGPAPGSPGAYRGGDPRRAFPWVLPGFVVGFLVGLLWYRANRPGKGFGLALLTVVLGLVTLGGALTIALVMFDVEFKLTMAALCVAFAALGLYAGLVWREHRAGCIAGVLAAFAGASPFVLVNPAWSFGAPIAALACAAIAWLVATVTAVMVVEHVEKSKPKLKSR